MKKSFIIIAIAMVASLSMVSCKNSNRKAQGPTDKEIQEMKLVLADSVLSIVDEIAEKYISISDTADLLKYITLSESEKMVKPDYLLDPSEVNNFFTKEQKINALGIYYTDYFVLKLYEMPTDATLEAMNKLVADLDFPFEKDFMSKHESASEVLKEEYRLFKERDEIGYFWQLVNSTLSETDYIISQDPELFYNYIPYEANVANNNQWVYFLNVIKQLAQYDEDIKAVYDLYVESYGESTDWVNGYVSVESSIASFKEDSGKIVEYRNTLLK